MLNACAYLLFCGVFILGLYWLLEQRKGAVSFGAKSAMKIVWTIYRGGWEEIYRERDRDSLCEVEREHIIDERPTCVSIIKREFLD